MNSLVKTVGRPALRQRIDSVIKTDPELDAFCLDYFPEIKRRFGSSMERLIKINLLLEIADLYLVADKLTEYEAKCAQGICDSRPSGTALKHTARIPQTLPPFVESERLKEAVLALEQHLNQKQHLVCLRGSPGDGKTQVGRWLMSRHQNIIYVELPIATEDGILVDAEKIWKEGIERLLENLTQERTSSLSLNKLCHAIRQASIGIEPPFIFILDNADHAASFDVHDLLADNGTACVLIGSGATPADREVSLRQPSSDEFFLMVTECIPVGSISPSDDLIIRSIGKLLDYAAIAAAYVASHIIPGIPSELRNLERDIALESPTFEPRIQAVFRKAWTILSVPAQQIAMLMAAFSEPEVPLIWIPKQLRSSGALSSLYRSRLVQGSNDIDGNERLRAHRLVIQWLRVNHSITNWAVVTDLLRQWSVDDELDESFKAGGPRKIAFNRAFELMATRKALENLDSKDRAFIELTYIDQSGLHGEGLDSARNLEHQVNYLAADNEALERLHPAVLGQLIDALRPRIIESSVPLRSLRARTVELLEKASPSLENNTIESTDSLTIIAEHHWGKFLNHEPGDRHEVGLKFLRSAEAKATEALMHAQSNERSRWLTRRAKTRLQIADALQRTSAEAIELLQEEQQNKELPEYLRITAATRLLKHYSNSSSDTIMNAVHETLKLCSDTLHEEICADFLAAATNIARAHRLPDLQNEVEQLTRERLDTYLAGAPASRRIKSTTAFATAKAAEGQIGADALVSIGKAIRLMKIAIIPGDDYIFSRSLAMVRDAGEIELAAKMVDDFRGQSSDFYLLFELAKTMRWAKRLDDAVTMLDRVEAAVRKHNAKQLLERQRTIRDERAKIEARRGDTAAVERFLRENIRAYTDAGQPQFARNCEDWLCALTDRQVSEAADGLLHDQWRSCQRRAAATADILVEISKDASDLVRCATSI